MHRHHIDFLHGEWFEWIRNVSPTPSDTSQRVWKEDAEGCVSFEGALFLERSVSLIEETSVIDIALRVCLSFSVLCLCFCHPSIRVLTDLHPSFAQFFTLTHHRIYLHWSLLLRSAMLRSHWFNTTGFYLFVFNILLLWSSYHTISPLSSPFYFISFHFIHFSFL